MHTHLQPISVSPIHVIFELFKLLTVYVYVLCEYTGVCQYTRVYICVYIDVYTGVYVCVHDVPTHDVHLPTHDVHLPTHDVHLPTHDVHLPTHDVHLPTHDVHLPTHDIHAQYPTTTPPHSHQNIPTTLIILHDYYMIIM